MSVGGGKRVGVHGCICTGGWCWQRAGQMQGERGSRRQTCSPALPFRWQKEEEEEEAEVVRRGVKKEAQVFSQGLLTDTKSVFVCLPGCQIKEFLCVGGLWPSLFDTSAPFVQQVSHRQCWPWESLGIRHSSSGERGSCLEKIFNGGGCWVGGKGGLGAVYRHIVGLCPNNRWNSSLL